MPRYDPELIAALAEGSLEPDEARRVESELAEDPDALAALEVQRQAIEAARTAPTPSLSDSESTHLRAAVAEALGLARDPEPVSEPRRISWSALATAGVALAALLAVVPVIGLLNTDGDDARTADAVSLEDTAETEAAADAAPEGSERSIAADEQDGAEAPAFEAPATTVSAETLPTPVPTTAGGEALDLAADLEILGADPEALARSSESATDETPCYEQAAAALGARDLSWFQLEDEESEVGFVVYTAFADGEPPRMIAFHPADCSVAASLP